MLSNKWNKGIGFTSFGESHGPVIGILLEDIKPGIRFPIETIQQALNERRPGIGAFTSSRKESDEIEILSGVFNGFTTGMPICIIVRNRDHNSDDYDLQTRSCRFYLLQQI